MQLFYSKQYNDKILIFDKEETRHCKVLRKSPGDILAVIDGMGYLMKCRLNAYKGEETNLEILESTLMSRQRNYRLHLYIAPTKQNDRIEWMLEKAVELGLDEITFIAGEHSERVRLNMNRLEKIAISAIKQSVQYYLPIINPITELKDITPSGTVLLAHCRADMPRKGISEVLHNINVKDVSVLIGPEGDFSVDEIGNLISKGAVPVSLGNTRLRTETAGVYISALMNAIL